MILPQILYREHLLGEYGEIHKHRHNFIKKHSINGQIFSAVQIELLSMLIRYDELTE